MCDPLNACVRSEELFRVGFVFVQSSVDFGSKFEVSSHIIIPSTNSVKQSHGMMSYSFV